MSDKRLFVIQISYAKVDTFLCYFPNVFFPIFKVLLSQPYIFLKTDFAYIQSPNSTLNMGAGILRTNDVTWMILMHILQLSNIP